MQKLLKTLRGLGPLGSFIATAIVFLTTNWGVVVSAGLALITGAWMAAYEFVGQPRVILAIFIFLCALWTYIGFRILNDRRKATIVTPERDYAYGLTWEGCLPNYVPNTETPLQFGLQLRNFSSGPLRYHIEKFQILIGDRTSPIGKPPRPTNFIPRGGVRLYRSQAFKQESLREFFGKTVNGTVEFSIAYGHPEQPPVRRLKMTLEITLLFNADGSAPLGFADSIIEESDEEINSLQ